MIITIPGTPIADSRPRARKRGNFVQIYDEKQNEKFIVKKFLTIETQKISHTRDFKELCEGNSFFIQFIFEMPIPASWSEKKRQKAHFEEINHVSKPDIDNLIKFYLDCCNKILYRDDSQISKVAAHKVYSLEPKTTIIFNTHKKGQILCV